jgi:hypothetical protein
MKTPLFRYTLFLFSIIVVLDVLAEVFYFHWAYWWYDVMLHFLGGFLIGMVVLLVWSVCCSLEEGHKLKVVGTGFLVALLIGVLWEVFELYTGQTFLSDGIVYMRDTSSDLLMDVCGGFFGTVYSFALMLKHDRQ